MKTSILIALLLLPLMACSDDERSDEEKYERRLPQGAVLLKKDDNDWVTFKYKGLCFLSYEPRYRSGLLSIIPCEAVEVRDE